MIMFQLEILIKQELPEVVRAYKESSNGKEGKSGVDLMVFLLTIPFIKMISPWEKRF